MPNLTSAIPNVPKQMRAVATLLLLRAAMSHVSVSKQLAAVDTGFLKENIHMGDTKDRRDTIEMSVISEAPYSVYVEFGTVKMAAQPFFIPGFESASSQLKAEASREIGSELAKVQRLKAA